MLSTKNDYISTESVEHINNRNLMDRTIEDVSCPSVSLMKDSLKRPVLRRFDSADYILSCMNKSADIPESFPIIGGSEKLSSSNINMDDNPSTLPRPYSASHLIASRALLQGRSLPMTSRDVWELARGVDLTRSSSHIMLSASNMKNLNPKRETDGVLLYPTRISGPNPPTGDRDRDRGVGVGVGRDRSVQGRALSLGSDCTDDSACSRTTEFPHAKISWKPSPLHGLPRCTNSQPSYGFHSKSSNNITTHINGNDDTVGGGCHEVIDWDMDPDMDGDGDGDVLSVHSTDGDELLVGGGTMVKAMSGDMVSGEGSGSGNGTGGGGGDGSLPSDTDVLSRHNLTRIGMGRRGGRGRGRGRAIVSPDGMGMGMGIASGLGSRLLASRALMETSSSSSTETSSQRGFSGVHPHHPHPHLVQAERELLCEGNPLPQSPSVSPVPSPSHTPAVIHTTNDCDTECIRHNGGNSSSRRFSVGNSSGTRALLNKALNRGHRFDSAEYFLEKDRHSDGDSDSDGHENMNMKTKTRTAMTIAMAAASVSASTSTGRDEGHVPRCRAPVFRGGGSGGGGGGEDGCTTSEEETA
eukprot:gene1734-3352_t